jgi:hypothetical protein
VGWKGYSAALASDPGGVRAVLATRIAATPERAAMSPSVVDELAWIIGNESDWNPAATNSIGATGLIQFMPATAAMLGTTTDALRKMSRKQQSRYVQKYFDRVTNNGSRKVRRKGDLYLLTFMPGHLNDADDGVIFDVGTKGWEQNPGLRVSPSGPITAGSVRARGTPTTPRPGAQKGQGRASSGGLGLALVVAAVAFLMRKP